ncbi:DEAD/DEAH box helicase family protein (plasmid) [Flagellatimonas centrodinii]|uniref:helicase-related protein n=1 Tax=Flagellatimonas centrodinii TaxID=2806210 RepID=UPI001FFBF427|nr:helicase-related protein [Flagellatimonas centrodinii]ULQ48322.1 DEAD/DEAH box helicase family protein [Flagellatimonas centrodinii]
MNALDAAPAKGSAAEEIATANDRPLLLPCGFDDLTVAPLRRFRARDLQPFIGQDVVVEAAVFRVVPDRRSLGILGVLIGQTGAGLMILGGYDSAPVLRYLLSPKRAAFLLYGRIRKESGLLCMRDVEPISREWCGQIRPRYPLDGRVVAAQVRRIADIEKDSYLADARAQAIRRAKVRSNLDSIVQSAAATVLEESLKHPKSVEAALGVLTRIEARTKLRGILRVLHKPDSMTSALAALHKIQVVAAVCMLQEGVEANFTAYQKRRRIKRDAPAVALEVLAGGKAAALARLCMYYPYTLTDEQQTAIWECLNELNGERFVRWLISGDVGTGKTDTFGAIARAMALSGHRVAVLCPTANLVRQTFAKLASWNPDVGMSFTAGREVEGDPETALIQVGTLALRRSARRFDLVVVDEQQRFARMQREELMSSAGHLIEATATCIPRTQGLADLGAIKVSRLRKCHVEKAITTRIFEHNERRALFAGVRESVEAGRKVLVFYPAIHGSGAAHVATLMEYEQAWRKLFGDRLGVVHGALKPTDAQAVIDQLRSNKVDVVLTTTLLEMGLDVPDIQRVVVVQAQRFGLTTLHQIRGRVARAGGEGYCDLYMLGDYSAKSRRRMEVMTRTTDGFVIARMDAQLRGTGDVTEHGHRQKGSLPGNPFVNLPVPPKAMDEAARALYKVWFDPAAEVVAGASGQPDGG